MTKRLSLYAFSFALKTGLGIGIDQRHFFFVLLVHRDGSGENKGGGERARKVLGGRRRCHLESIGLETTAGEAKSRRDEWKVRKRGLFLIYPLHFAGDIAKLRQLD